MSKTKDFVIDQLNKTKITSQQQELNRREKTKNIWKNRQHRWESWKSLVVNAPR